MALPAPRSSGTALVTGASAGIGSEIARELAKRRFGVTLVARREDRLRELATELNQEHGVRAEVIGCDLGSADGRASMASELRQLELEVDVLVNNAGFGFAGEFINSDRDRQTAMVALNCEAVVDLTGRYTPAMVRRGAGAVINIASTAAFQPMPGSATYGASKAFVLSFSEAVHTELGGTGVSVTAVCPGPVRTEFTEAAGMEGADESLPELFWLSAADVASDAVKAAEAGRRSVINGKINFAGSLLGRYTPRTISLPISKRFWGRAE